MHFCYSDVSDGQRGKFDLSKVNPDKAVAKHLENWYYLKFIYVSPGSNPIERMQASKELEICERKIKFWERRVDQDRFHALITQEKVKWSVDYAPSR